MGKIKIKNPNEVRMAKLQEVFGIDSEHVEYSIEGNTITLPNNIVATFTKDVKDIEGYDLLKDITIEVKVNGIEFTLNWQQDHGAMWIVHAIVNKLIATPRQGGTSSGLSAAQKAILKAERLRFNEAKKQNAIVAGKKKDSKTPSKVTVIQKGTVC